MDDSAMHVTERCYAVTGLGYSTPWCVNAGFVVGNEVTLIVDTGANRLAAETLLGYASAVRPGNALRVVNTEKHFDHIGGNGLFRERGVDVWGHRGIARTRIEGLGAEFVVAGHGPVAKGAAEVRGILERVRGVLLEAVGHRSSGKECYFLSKELRLV